jgi:hypothetical protein
MPVVLPNTTTTNDYKDVHLGGGGMYARGQLVIANNPVSLRITTAPEFGQERVTEYPYVTPTVIPLVSGVVFAGKNSSPIPERIVGVEVKDASSGTHAQVSGWLIEAGLAGPDVGSPFTSSVSASGSVTPGLSALQFQKNGVLIGTEPILDFVDAAGFAWTMADDVANTRVTVTPPAPLTNQMRRFQSILASTTVVNSAAETTLCTFTVPAGSLGATLSTGAAIMRSFGVFLNATGGNVDYGTLKVYLNGVACISTGSIGSGGGVATGGFYGYQSTIEILPLNNTVVQVAFKHDGGCGGSALLSGAWPLSSGTWTTWGGRVMAEGITGGVGVSDLRLNNLTVQITVQLFAANPNLENVFEYGYGMLST